MSLEALTGQVGVLSRAGAGGVVRGRDGRLAYCQSQKLPRFHMEDWDADGVFEQAVLLMEGALSNSCLQSETFGNATWTKTRSSIAADTSLTRAPDGSFNADRLLEDATAASTHFIQQTVTITAAEFVVWSVYVKAAGRTNVRLSAANGADSIIADFVLSGSAVISPAAFTSASGAGSNTFSRLDPQGDGWYRLELGGKINAASTAIDFAVRLSNGASTSYNGDGASGVFLWGAQVIRCGATGVTSQTYIGPTAAAAVTRSEESLKFTGALTWPFQDFTAYVKFGRPPYAAMTGTHRTTPYLGRLGASNPQASLNLIAGSRNISGNISDAVPTFAAPSKAMPSGTSLEMAVQYKNLTSGNVAGLNGPQAAIDVNDGTGMGAFSGAGILALTAWGSTDLYIGNAGAAGAGFAPDCGIAAVKLAAGLRSLAEMREAW